MLEAIKFLKEHIATLEKEAESLYASCSQDLSAYPENSRKGGIAEKKEELIGELSQAVKILSVHHLKALSAKEQAQPNTHTCNCDGCGQPYEEPNPADKFGEFNLCPKCKNRTDLWLD